MEKVDISTSSQTTCSTKEVGEVLEIQEATYSRVVVHMEDLEAVDLEALDLEEVDLVTVDSGIVHLETSHVEVFEVSLEVDSAVDSAVDYVVDMVLIILGMGTILPS